MIILPFIYIKRTLHNTCVSVSTLATEYTTHNTVLLIESSFEMLRQLDHPRDQPINTQRKG